MNNFYKAVVLITVTTIVSACTTDPNINNVKVHTNQAYQPAMAVNVSEKKQILGIVRKFATSVACSTSFDDDPIVKTTVDDVFLVGTNNLGSLGDKDFNSDYLVYWSGDMGCSGGVVDNTSFMTSVNRISDTRPFLIETDYGRNDIRHDDFFHNLDIYPRFVDGTNGWLGNAPRYKYRYTVKGEAHEEWKVIGKKLLVDRKIDSEDF